MATVVGIDDSASGNGTFFFFFQVRIRLPRARLFLLCSRHCAMTAMKGVDICSHGALWRLGRNNEPKRGGQSR